MLEIELKVRVDDLNPVRERLLSHHAVPESRVRERDVYFNAPDRDFAVTDEALRVRFAGGTCTLTYKGPRKREFSLKARDELNCRVESGEILMKILRSLGFRHVAEVRKSREYYRLGNALISLDLVEGLGTFVEIEVSDPDKEESPAEYVQELAGEIGIHGEPILSSYLELLLGSGQK